MSWKAAAAAHNRELAEVPKGCSSIEDIAAELGCSVDKAREIVNALVKKGRAERVSGKKLTQTGALVAAVYYRLSPTGKPGEASRRS